MICGPHHDPPCPGFHEGTLCFSRLDHAIRQAHERNAVLLLAGDGNRGADVRRFYRHAYEKGTEKCIVPLIYGKGIGSTLFDVQMALDFLTRQHQARPFENGVELILVTDPWHMERAAHMLAGELRNHAALRASIRTSDVEPFWNPPPEAIERERTGLLAYAAKKYQPTKDAWGKPAALVPTANE